ncbi:MAG: PAS domain-containing protein, partial [Chloroflexi bacterium]|nr:PAS domain-containing protein [Chloroflexota bacterium]
MLGEPDKTEVRSVEPATTGAMCQGAEDALRASEPLYHSLVEALPQSLCRKDLEGRFTFANSRFCDSLNKTLDEIIGRTDLDIHPPDLAEKYRRDDRWVIETGQNLEVIEEHLPLGGQSAWVQVLKTPVRDADGTIMGVQIIFWDVTDRVQAEDELARYRVRLEDLVEERTVKLGQANERLRHEIARRQQVQEALTRERDLLYALMDNIPDTIYFKDTASRFTRINKAQARLLGAQDPEAAVGKTDQDFFASEHAQAAYADEQAIVASGQPLIDKIERLRGADGQWRWVSATKAPIVGQDGRVVGLVGISRDVT